MSGFAVNVQHDLEVTPALEKQVEVAALATLRQEHQAPASLSILLTDEQRIRAINRAFRGFDEPTDVLSFPFESPVVDDEDYLGDVVIALPVAEAQANASGHSTGEELSLLVVHGVLHLLGRDHADSEQKAAMWQAQRTVLAALGLERIAPAH
jgi:probable rRNA maturation factor